MTRARRPLIAAFLLAAVAAAVPATAATAATASHSSGPVVKDVNPKDYVTFNKEPYERWEFRSPSGNLRCSINSGEDAQPWGCVAVQHGWDDPDLPDAFDQTCADQKEKRVSGAMWALSPGGGFDVTCGQAYVGAKQKVLPLNRRIRMFGVSCTSTRIDGEEAMRCTAPKKTSLTIGTNLLLFTQPKGWKG